MEPTDQVSVRASENSKKDELLQEGEPGRCHRREKEGLEQAYRTPLSLVLWGQAETRRLLAGDMMKDTGVSLDWWLLKCISFSKLGSSGKKVGMHLPTFWN